MEIEYDFDGSLRLTDVVEDFFYSPSTGLFVFRHPLYVDDRVLAAAGELGLAVEASPEKWLVKTPLATALRLLRHLGSTALSLPEYFRVRRDAIAAGDRNMAASLESHEFIEMLDTVFLHDQYVIHHPHIEQGFTGEKTPVTTPAGRYGWIHPDDIDLDTGLPTKVQNVRNLQDETLKYWDTHTEIGRSGVLMSVRGYVTSVGKMSLDLGFPATAVSYKLTMRECQRSRPAGALDEQLIGEAKAILAKYYAALDDKSIYRALPDWTDELLAFVDKNHEAMRRAFDTAGKVLMEDCRDVFGLASRSSHKATRWWFRSKSSPPAAGAMDRSCQRRAVLWTHKWGSLSEASSRGCARRVSYRESPSAAAPSGAGICRRKRPHGGSRRSGLGSQVEVVG